VINHPATGYYTYDFPTALPKIPHAHIKFACGDWVTLQEGQVYEMDVLIGEHPGGEFGAWLLVERKDFSYERTATGSPLLPLFRVSNVKMPAVDVGCPPYEKREIGWSTAGDGADSMGETSTEAAPNPSTN
jgi:hypothetical protein